MAEHFVVGVYKMLGEAEAAVHSLSDGGFPVKNVSMIAANLEDIRRLHGLIVSNVSHWSEAAGMWAGGIFGVLVGAAFVWVPGFGPLIVAGSLGSMLIGGVEGAMAGAVVTGVLGWLVGLGIARECVGKYEEAVKAGKYLIIAHGAADLIEKARDILARSGAEQLDLHPGTRI